MAEWTVTAWPILVSAALKSTFVLGAAWLITWLLRSHSAAARHVVWTACSDALIALPLFSVALPAVRVRMANGVLLRDSNAVVFRTTAEAHTGSGTPTVSKAPARRAGTAAGARAEIGWRSAVVLVWAAGLAFAIMQMLRAC